MEEIIKYIHKNSWFQLDGYIEDFEWDNELIFATRRHGNVGDETYGQEDWDEGSRIMLEVMRNFNHLIKIYHLTTCDEWVNIEIKLK